jgi:hypothetical protein
MSTKTLDPALKSLLKSGTVLPAIPLALNSSRQFDEARQRGLARYYVATGAGGLAVAVHSTQFEIRDPEINLFETVLRVVSDEIDNPQIQAGHLLKLPEFAAQLLRQLRKLKQH